MSRGSSDIPTLRNEVLQKFVTKFTLPPDLLLMNLFSSERSPSSTVKWEEQIGFRGMTPFSTPGAPAHQTAPLGVAERKAEAAYWKEKMPFDEEFLNNLREEGTTQTYLTAERRIAREMAQLTNRSNRRKEWMFAKMIVDGTLTYTSERGEIFTLTYGVPSSHLVTLTTNQKWSNGTSRDIIEDIIVGKQLIQDDTAGKVNMAICTSTVLKYIAKDPTLQTLLQKSAFGQGDLFNSVDNKIVGVNTKVLGALLDIDSFIIYDQQYQVRGWLTGTVTADTTTTISVDNAQDFEVGETLRFVDVSVTGAYEDETIASVDVQAGTVTVSTAPSTSYKAGEDYVQMTRNFIPRNRFCMIASQIEGVDMAEFREAPFGLGRTYGNFTDKHDDWDPDVTWIRIQNKGLPVMYHPEATYILTVA